MKKEFFILIGRSGSGKGTQATILKEKLEAAGYGSVVHLTTGGSFREFITTKSYAATRAKEINNSGGLMPAFLAIWNWANLFIHNFSGKETVLFDGAPRKLIEVEALHSAIHFFEYEHPTVVYIDVSETWAKDKLRSRGRQDDKDEEDMERKMNWFLEDVLPCIDHYAHNPLYRYVRVNGEQSVDEVHASIVELLAEKGLVL